jgi:hypothetical protein
MVVPSLAEISFTAPHYLDLVLKSCRRTFAHSQSRFTILPTFNNTSRSHRQAGATNPENTAVGLESFPLYISLKASAGVTFSLALRDKYGGCYSLQLISQALKP